MFGLNPGLIAAPTEDFLVYPATVSATTALSGKELAYSLNFPRKSIPGLPVIECAGFGRNISTFDGTEPTKDDLHIGRVFHMHHKEPARVALSKDSLTAHTFITGSTGAGKTNTVCKILERASRSGAKFMVVEPAKGEYKNIFGGYDDVSVYGTNPLVAPLLKINPFSFPEGVHVLEHLDRLVEVFNVCWPMYAAMPAVLKDAIERSYVDCGWNLLTSENEFGQNLYPNLKDVARNVKAILDSSEYDAENKGAYKGSLLTRLNSLTTGINGMILADNELPADQLFNSNVIVDLSRVGSMETKSLLMGLLVLKLQEFRMSEGLGMNLPLRHLTVLEEAHNLLKRTSTEQPTEDGNLLGKSVEMLSNAIAEMRTYGEGFVIADQAPGLLDMAVIRNTNTKIIMRLPDLEDRQLAGKAANLTDEQITELARLPKGVAAIYQNDWIEPVLCKIDKAEDGAPFVFEHPDNLAPSSPDYEDALFIADLLADCNEITSDSTLNDIDAALKRLQLDSSMAATIKKTLANPPVEPMMTKLGPIMSTLFPNIRKAAEASYARSKVSKDWTKDTEAVLYQSVGPDMGAITRRVIVQGVITDLLHNDLKDEKSFDDWYHKGDLS